MWNQSLCISIKSLKNQSLCFLWTVGWWRNNLTVADTSGNVRQAWWDKGLVGWKDCSVLMLTTLRLGLALCCIIANCALRNFARQEEIIRINTRDDLNKKHEQKIIGETILDWCVKSVCVGARPIERWAVGKQKKWNRSTKHSDDNKISPPPPPPPPSHHDLVNATLANLVTLPLAPLPLVLSSVHTEIAASSLPVYLRPDSPSLCHWTALSHLYGESFPLQNSNSLSWQSFSLQSL